MITYFFNGITGDEKTFLVYALITTKTIVIITTLFYFGTAFKLSDEIVFPQIKVVNEALESFQRQTRQAGANLEQSILVLFAVGDTNRNGLISSSELSSFLSTFGGLSQETANEISNIFVRFGDTNGDGELSRQEYRTVARTVGQ
ncbi:hypothetical protein KUTeg_006518 [Tegillarca granosa]|uniref:EF-hand domain-containing protein n=1 Tax=Tegillarca granosa TaxID=220873 RepID=A0ABQ9FGU2_TEGGR|nr:hypothetical protein KUTeg_006518 [Tegillarca granosa]